MAAEEIFTDAGALASCVAQCGAYLTINFGVDLGFVFRFRIRGVGFGGFWVVGVRSSVLVVVIGVVVVTGFGGGVGLFGTDGGLARILVGC